jgi:hypothetical protein
MAIKWEQLGQPTFDETVEVLITRRFKNTGTVTVPDGRGGDGGIDILYVGHDGHRRIFQLKYFPEGFSSGWARTRRPQIRNSFKTALQHEPDEWTLVVPGLVTDHEREFVEGLNAGSTPPTISILGRNDLNDWLADDPNLDTSLQRNPTTTLQELARDFNLEKAALLGGWKDVAERVRNLGTVVDGVDPDWTVDFARIGDTQILAVRPQHPLAAERNPVGIAVETNELPESVSAHIERVLGYGMSTPIVIPGDAVESITMTGPKFLAGPWPPGEVQIELPTHAPAIGKPIEFRLWDANGVAASYEGTITYAGSGGFGGTIDASFFDGRLIVNIHLPHDPDLSKLPDRAAAKPGVSLRVEYGPDAPRLVADVLEAARLIRVSSRLEIHIDGQHAATVSGFPPPTDEDFGNNLAIEQYADDLAIVQRHCKQHFGIPQFIQPGERVAMRVARLLVDGHIVASPKAQLYAVEFTGEDSPELRTKLQQPRPIAWKSPIPYTVTAGDRTLTIGEVYAIHPAAVVDNLEEVTAALDAGTSDGIRVNYRPGDDPFFHLVCAGGPSPELTGKQIAFWTLHGVTQPGVPGALAQIPGREADPEPAATPHPD